jgi:hypothetical protein
MAFLPSFLEHLESDIRSSVQLYLFDSYPESDGSRLSALMFMKYTEQDGLQYR